MVTVEDIRLALLGLLVVLVLADIADGDTDVLAFVRIPLAGSFVLVAVVVVEAVIVVAVGASD